MRVTAGFVWLKQTQHSPPRSLATTAVETLERLLEIIHTGMRIVIWHDTIEHDSRII